MRVNPSPSTPAPRGRRRRRLRTHERKREIVATVLDIARERGPDAITTQAIADRIGVSQAALFKHFPDKQAIWLAVFAWIREALGAEFDAAVAAGTSPLDRLERAFIAHVGFVAEHPGVPRVLFHELQYPDASPVRAEVRSMILAYRKRIAALVREAKAAGELPPELETALAPVLFIGAVQGLVIDASLTGEEARMIRRARPALRVLVDGLRGAR